MFEVGGESLDFAGAAVGFFAEVGVGVFAPALDLSGGEKAEVGLSVSSLSELEVGVDLGFEFGADGVQQFAERVVICSFVYGVSGANVAHSRQIAADFLFRSFCFGRHGGKFNPLFPPKSGVSARVCVRHKEVNPSANHHIIDRRRS